MIGTAADDIKMNIYDTIWTYPGPGSYTITMTDPNRNDGIVNVPNQSAFSIYTVLTIFNAPGLPAFNSSPTLVNPPIDKACSGALFIHNAGAIDPDGDSLSYKMGFCHESPGVTVGGYYIPANVSIDPITGDLTWNTPPAVIGNSCDEYNLAFDIEEWAKQTTTGKRVLIGVVRRDMQVRVCDCDNDPPIISDVKDTCIEANTALTFTVTATDQSGDYIQTFDANGGPFAETPPALFTSDAPNSPTATGVFSWTPSCEQIRKGAYLVTFRAVDDGAPDLPPIPLTDYETFFIRVIAPPVKNLKGDPECTTIQLSWDPAICNPASNPLKLYKIYRKTGCDTLKPGYCETGMPPAWGYSLIQTQWYTSTSFLDNNGGQGLVHGLSYSYRVVAEYVDGSESYVSDPICVKLTRDVPIITNVDVTSTGSNGSIDIKWVKPVASPTEYDTTAPGNTGPYSYELKRSPGFVLPVSLIQSYSSPYFATLNAVSHTDAGINTQGVAFNYRLDFFDTAYCPTQTASSIFLSCTPNDNELLLTWKVQVPWVNSQYDVYKYDGTNWNLIGTTTGTAYTDTGLVNGQTYCYKVRSTGAYPDTTIPAPLINWSQELCCSPIDLTPPCPLTLALDSNCEEMKNVLNWNNPNLTCCDDAVYYVIYYMEQEGQDFTVLDTVHNILTTTYLHDSVLSIAGCYAVTAVDSFGNESAFSNIICVDNCPLYQLPNVFTPNGDNSNDFFTPLIPYRYVKDIDIRIYNRWGYEVFRTTDPMIGWDGKSAQTGSLCSDGVYYYVCTVNEIRLKGIIPRIMKGNVHLLSR